ncbi:hypothetical protein [Actinoplanes teichomyceticus]|uniref:Holliday junction resolvase n=1 Tax=Actinoplanes teichomyceticus TaxID=1867 RepID=A0A561WAW3_ACTTI|nr:hypothetical protein [Actinoplanes teichomyceticus]TWG21000.1 hypothetical protein FHX34_103529 [Actinoplanes teichomyceticus]GIF14820.1 hypothetical protein Ate01nite_48520 [Actinoplanes teichomyceticus]
MSASRKKGTAWESSITAYLSGAGFPGVERRALTGSQDKGDVAGLPLVIEAKNCKTTTLAAWVDEASAEAKHAGVAVGVVWHHRRGKSSPGDGFVTMSGEDFVTLLVGAVPLLAALAKSDEPAALVAALDKVRGQLGGGA